MADKGLTLKATIELAGGDEIKRQLDQIGDAGKKAFDSLAADADKAGKSLQQIPLDEINKKAQQFGITGPQALQKFQQAVASAARIEGFLQALQAIQNGFLAIGQTAQLVGQAILQALGPVGVGLAGVAAAAVAASAQMDALAQNAAKVTEPLRQMATQFNTTVPALDQLRAGFNAAGQSSETFRASMEGVNKAISTAAVPQVQQLASTLQALKAAGIVDVGGLAQLARIAGGIGPAAEAAAAGLAKMGVAGGGITRQIPTITQLKDALSKLGISATDASGKLVTVDQVLPQIADKFAAMQDGAKKTALAMQLFGAEAGPKIIPLLNAGSQGIAGLAEEYKRLGLTVTTAQSEMGRRLIESNVRVEESAKRVQTTLGLMFADGTAAFNNYRNDVLLKMQAFFQDPSFQRFGEVLSAIWDPIAQRASAAWDSISQVAGQALDAIRISVSDRLTLGWEAITQGAQAAWDGAVSIAQQALESIKQLVSAPVEGAWQWIVDTFNSIMEQVLARARAVAETLKELFTQSPEVGGAGGAGTGTEFAPGGFDRGGYTGSGDIRKIAGFVHRGEHVQPAYVVRQPGVLAFLEALRRAGGDLQRVIAGVRGYDLGGFVGGLAGGLRALQPMPIPAFAGGGPVGRGPNLGTLTLEIGRGGAQVQVMASTDAVEQLRKAAALSQVRSGGRKPSRYT